MWWEGTKIKASRKNLWYRRTTRSFLHRRQLSLIRRAFSSHRQKSLAMIRLLQLLKRTAVHWCSSGKKALFTNHYSRCSCATDRKSFSTAELTRVTQEQQPPSTSLTCLSRDIEDRLELRRREKLCKRLKHIKESPPSKAPATNLWAWRQESCRMSKEIWKLILTKVAFPWARLFSEKAASMMLHLSTKLHWLQSRWLSCEWPEDSYVPRKRKRQSWETSLI